MEVVQMKQKRIRLFSLLMAAVLLVAAESVLFASASSTPEAAINGAVYETIEEAIAAAVPGDMIELLTSINDGSRGLTFDKPLTLSLASCPDFVRLGYISATEDLTIQGPGTLWVQQALVNRQAGSYTK